MKKLIVLLKNSIASYKYQYGFRIGHSTNRTFIEIPERIGKARDLRKVTCGIFVVVQKAFDTVIHEIILEKLEQYGIRNISTRVLDLT